MTAIDTKVGAASKMFDVNVLGPMRMVHHFHDLLISASGTIVNIGSVGGIVPYVYGCELNNKRSRTARLTNPKRFSIV
jgi:1-acylglycerone phosphate reductase